MKLTKTDYLLICLIEEAAKIQKSATKALRFGLDNHHPNSPETETNRKKLACGLGDISGVVNLLYDANVVTTQAVIDATIAKIKKLEQCISYAEDDGIIDTVTRGNPKLFREFAAGLREIMNGDKSDEQN